MTITTSIDAVGLLKATDLIQSARAEAAIAHRAGLHTVTMVVPESNEAGSQARRDARGLPVPPKRVVDISV
ncbi:hypothetical protein [Methylobacterium sp. GC_Met_2]|uniref:hypothetical protein n=1 Tax=Methylobacterium sp. GC_Met_2 TaxID=2937376 RepID=UPI00226B512D|nr:hypothetical protein [Methylobacterium sp. GC_Met_2]